MHDRQLKTEKNSLPTDGSSDALPQSFNIFFHNSTHYRTYNIYVQMNSSFKRMAALTVKAISNR